MKTIEKPVTTKHKYTVVYATNYMCGSHTNTTTRYAHIETDDLKETLNTDDRFDCSVWFVFEGHCQPQADWMN